MVEITEIVEGDRVDLRKLELRLFRDYLKRSKAVNWEELSQELIDQLGASSEDAFDFHNLFREVAQGRDQGAAGGSTVKTGGERAPERREYGEAAEPVL